MLSTDPTETQLALRAARRGATRASAANDQAGFDSWQRFIRTLNADRVAEVAAAKQQPEHDCDEHAVTYESDGALGHGWECGICGKFLQAG